MVSIVIFHIYRVTENWNIWNTCDPVGRSNIGITGMYIYHPLLLVSYVHDIGQVTLNF